jgi:putative membrane protein
MKILINFAINIIALILAAYILPGIRIDNFLAALIAALTLGIINTGLKPINVILTLPATIISLGLFYFVINAFMVLIAAWLVPGFAVAGFFSALLFSFVFTLIKLALEKIFNSKDIYR